MPQPAELASSGSSNLSLQLMRQVRDAVQNGFVSRGLVPTSRDQADLIVFVHGGTQERFDVEEWSPGFRRFGGAYIGRTEIDRYTEGTVRIDVFDARSGELVWRGSAAAEVFDRVDRDKVTATVTEIVSRYPN